MSKKEKEDIPRLVIPEDASLQEIYAKARQEFTAVDLQKYTEIELMVPMEEVLAEMEIINKRHPRNRRQK